MANRDVAEARDRATHESRGALGAGVYHDVSTCSGVPDQPFRPYSGDHCAKVRSRTFAPIVSECVADPAVAFGNHAEITVGLVLADELRRARCFLGRGQFRLKVRIGQESGPAGIALSCADGFTQIKHVLPRCRSANGGARRVSDSVGTAMTSRIILVLWAGA